MLHSNFMNEAALFDAYLNGSEMTDDEIIAAIEWHRIKEAREIRVRKIISIRTVRRINKLEASEHREATACEVTYIFEQERKRIK